MDISTNLIICWGNITIARVTFPLTFNNMPIFFGGFVIDNISRSTFVDKDVTGFKIECDMRLGYMYKYTAVGY